MDVSAYLVGRLRRFGWRAVCGELIGGRSKAEATNATFYGSKGPMDLIPRRENREGRIVAHLALPQGTSVHPDARN
jgi:hypothetical protein